MEDSRQSTAEIIDGRIVFVLYKNQKFLSLVQAPEDTRVGDESIIYSDDEGPYVIIKYKNQSHQCRIENYLLHKPGQSISDALDETGLDEESLLPRF